MKAPTEEIYAKNQRKEHYADKCIQWVTSYNAVSDVTIRYRPIFIRFKSAFREFRRKFELIAVQGHRSWFQSK